MIIKIPNGDSIYIEYLGGRCEKKDSVIHALGLTYLVDILQNTYDNLMTLTSI